MQTDNQPTITAEQPTKSLDERLADWLMENNATLAVVAVAPVTKERIGLVNLMALNWPIEVHVVPKQESVSNGLHA